ncbi:DNA-processing protein DprA [Methylovirgula sp. 4M-Z18]|uniref:DNA-processing protein DprA n=1 Tax=Methylovirgula sp. 4M-Z18 TaxID=2293567 RepID=UPI000E2E8300|nr:DNA-processing protein DprA [Methylovirgula sp. 4M-Z18]RFB80663.1 DNA-protecting protein DprA [Methylovirgula sp. 4M-Z18]
MSSALSEAERFHRLWLIRSENIGPRTFRLLLRRFGSAQAALEALPSLTENTKPIRLAPRDDIAREMEALQRRGIRLLAMDEPGYPPLLAVCDDAPPLLSVQGRLEALQRPMVSIVGSRNASAAGLAFTDQLTRGLGRAGYVIVSGLARGIDARAHRASLQSGTVAVLPGGHAAIYPSEHEELAEQIAENGAIISEMPLGWEPRGRDFPRRNRIVASLSLGTIVVEAARRSGSLITAKFAGERGREVFAVPGSPLDPRAEGPNDLLRHGAALCASVEDVTQVLDTLRDRAPGGDLFTRPTLTFDLETEEPRRDVSAGAAMPAAPDLPSETVSPVRDDGADPVQSIRALLGPAPISVDELVRSARLPARDVQTLLFELELAGEVERHGGNLVSIITKKP